MHAINGAPCTSGKQGAQADVCQNASPFGTAPQVSRRRKGKGSPLPAPMK